MGWLNPVCDCAPEARPSEPVAPALLSDRRLSRMMSADIRDVTAMMHVAIKKTRRRLIAFAPAKDVFILSEKCLTSARVSALQLGLSENCRASKSVQVQD
jgi:hypothetical protein